MLSGDPIQIKELNEKDLDLYIVKIDIIKFFF